MKRIFFFLLMLLNVAVVSAQSKILQTRLEHNVVYENNTCLKVLVDFEATGQHHSFRPVALVFDAPDHKSQHLDTNGINRSTTGCVCAYGHDVEGPYDLNHVTDSEIYLPLSEIHPYAGHHTYYLKVWILDITTNQYVAEGAFIPFDMTRN